MRWLAAAAALGGMATLWWSAAPVPPPADPVVPAPSVEAPPVVAFRYARNVAILPGPGCRILTVTHPWRPEHPAVRIALVPRGGPRPGPEIADAVVEVPVRRLALSSTTLIAFLDQLDGWDALAACAATDYAWNPKVHERVAAQQVVVLPADARPDPERLLPLRLDAYLHAGLEPLDGAAAKLLAAAGAAPIPICEFAEEHPLGRAEWLKVFGALLGKEAAAATAFDGIARRYEALAKLGRQAKRRPKLLVNAPYRGEWFLPAAGNNFARLLADAGADCPWAARGGRESLKLDLEEALRIAADADVWLNPGAAKTRGEVLALDPRLQAFQALGKGQVFASDRRLSPNGGGSDFWETAMARPDLYLADVLAALHPELLPGHQPRWLRRLP